MFEKKIEEISSSSSSMVSNVHLPPYLSLGSDASISSSHQRHKPINTDMISNLPDNVLIHILSFLTTLDAIRTSILSTKWRYLWTYLPAINFLICMRYKINSFLDILTTLIHKSNHHRMEIETLSIYMPAVALDAHRVTFFVTSLLKLNVIDLKFCIGIQKKYLDTSCVLPHGFSASYSLSKLKLALSGYTLCIPNSVQFPSLKTLDLSYVTFANEESVEQFFSGCPVLEELTLNYCYWLLIKQITIAISTLRMLTIRFKPDCLPHCTECKNFSVKIDAVNLLSLTCTSDPTIKFVIVNPPTSIVDAYIALSSHFPQVHHYAEYVSHCSNVLLSGLASVKSLTLSKDTFMEPEPPFEDDHFHLLPEFHNLTHLCLHLETSFFTRKSFTQFLLRCPKVEVLVFPLGYNTFKDNQDWTFIPLPSCFKSSLKKLHITNFDGFECEIQFVEFFLENAAVLEEFQISLSCSPLSKYDSNNLADLKNRFIGMGSCDINFRSSKHVIVGHFACDECGY